MKVTDTNALKELGFTKAQTMKTITKYFATQLFSHGFLHCDPHPGIIINNNFINSSSSSSSNSSSRTTTV